MNVGKDRCGKVIYFEIFGENFMKIIAMGLIFFQITNY
jgi:hypothetical protein